MSIPTAEEVLKQNHCSAYLLQNVLSPDGIEGTHYDRLIKSMLQFAELHVQAALEAAEKGAKASIIYADYNDFSKGIGEGAQVDCIGDYPLENIK